MSCNGLGDFLKESGATGYAQGSEGSYGGLARRICCQVILFEWFIRIFVLKDLLFAISDKGEESVALKKRAIAFRFLSLVPE